MQTSQGSSRTRLLMLVGVLIIAGAIGAYFLTTPGNSNSSATASLSSKVSSLSQVIASQESQIASLQSGQNATTSTVTLSSGGQTVTETTTKTAASPTTTTVSSVVTSLGTTTLTTTSTETVAITTVIPVKEPSVVSLSGTLTIPGGNGSGSLLLTVANTGNDPIIAVNVAVPAGADPTMDLCMANCTLSVTFDGQPISSNNPVPGENNAGGTLATTEGETGNSYTITATVDFADGTTQVVPVMINAVA